MQTYMVAFASAALATLIAAGSASAASPGIGASISDYLPAPNGEAAGPSADPPTTILVAAGIGATAYGTAARISSSLAALQPDRPSSTRGALEAGVYRNYSNAVVLIVTDNGLGSGALIAPNGTIITNYHVVGDSKFVGVVFKPTQEGAQITKRDLVRGEVLRVDQVADLAIVKVASVPANAHPLLLGTVREIEVGEDVHAIGHPTGEAWTYTRGIVSQIRQSYRWTTESGLEHEATVIQTQTPINPGNSGGPLMDNLGQLIGVNSFKSDGEGLNFAVGVDAVQGILTRTGNRYARHTPQPDKANAVASCEPIEGKQRRLNDSAATGTAVDLDCDGRFEAVMIVPDSPTEAIVMIVDTDSNGKVDYCIVDEDRDGNPDREMYDTDKDGELDLVGYFHPGATEAYRFERM